MDSRVPIIGGVKGTEPILDCNEIRPQDSHEASMAKVEYFIAKSIGAELANTYPNREWSVNVDVRNQMVVIQNPSLSGMRGYCMHIGGDTIADLCRRARKAGGEILERYGLSRDRKFDPAEVEALPRGLRDEVNTKDSAPEPLHKGIALA